MVGFNRRFDPDFVAAKAAIDAGAIGAVEMVTITSRDPGAPPYDYITRSGGIFRDMTIHDFDMARWLLGEEPETVMASASVLTDPKIGELGDYDSVNVILRTASGRQAIITNSRRATYGYDQRIEVLGSAGAVVQTIPTSRGPRSRRPQAMCARRCELLHDPLYRRLCRRDRGVHRGVRDGKTPPTTGVDGLRALALADAAVLSVSAGRAVRVTEILG
ncbi:MAG: Gfo/Idh/MocA family oxidoreductase [Rhodobacteraceae bacterium]|nr:Gfo/Idh/MocA family oxidoreductase [Paracoccaceae bacterium]